MFAARVAAFPGREPVGVPPRRPAIFFRVGASLRRSLRALTGWRTDPDVRQYEQRREAMAALDRVTGGRHV